MDEIDFFHDPRYYDLIEEGLASKAAANAERIRKSDFWFGLPSMPALFLNMAHEAWLANEKITLEEYGSNIATDGDPNSETFDVLESCIKNVVFSLSAIEAFANQSIPHTFTFSSAERQNRWTQVYNKNQIERNINLADKLNEVLPLIFHVVPPKTHVETSGNTWNKFRTLNTVRDRIIHLKSTDAVSSGPDLETIWGTLLKSKSHNFALDSAEIIKYFFSSQEIPRWLRKFPY